MDELNMKNIVVLKELPSNLVEEAIVILKENVDLKGIRKKREKITVSAKQNSKDYIIKEAEAVVTDYISNLEAPKQFEITNSKIKRKYKNLQKLTAFFAIVAVLGIIINFI